MIIYETERIVYEGRFPLFCLTPSIYELSHSLYPFNGWLHLLSFRTFLITFCWQWDKTLGTPRAIITRARKINYLQSSQLSVVIEDSRWQLLYLVVTQFPKKKYSLISVKVSFFRNCCYCRFLFYFFCWINSLFMSCPDQTRALL